MKAGYKKIKIITGVIEKDETSKNKKAIDYGLAILKLIQAFLVIAAHNYNKDSTKNKIIIFITRNRHIHVPSFWIMSFHFNCHSLLSLKLKYIIRRFLRLLIPYIGWPIITWKINHLWNKKYKTRLPDTYRELKSQLLWGREFIIALWFQWNLIAITFMFIIVIFIFRKYSLFIFHLLLVIFYILQYSGFYYEKILQEFPIYNRYTLIYFFESVPYAITGFTLGYYNIISFLNKFKIRTLILSLLIYNAIDDYNILSQVKGLSYVGIKFNIQALCIVFIFSLFPSDKIKNKSLSKFLIMLSNYTGGIFYTHIPFSKYLAHYFNEIKNGTFLGLIITYLFLYIFCFIGMLIFGKTPFKYLFC